MREFFRIFEKLPDIFLADWGRAQDLGYPTLGSVGRFVAVNSIRESPRVSGRNRVQVERLQDSGFSLLALREL
jgi:hypothetical protein